MMHGFTSTCKSPKIEFYFCPCVGAHSLATEHLTIGRGGDMFSLRTRVFFYGRKNQIMSFLDLKAGIIFSSKFTKISR